MSGKLKIREIAQVTGLSISTVSRVLAGKANTSEKARQQVMAYARAHGVLNDLSGSRLLMNNLTIFAPARAFNSRTDIFYYDVIQGITRTVEKGDIRLRYCPIDEVSGNIALFIEQMTQKPTDAALLIGIDDPQIHALAADLQKPCVLINSYDKTMRLDCVLPDHQTIGEFAMRYLLAQGHRQIVTLTSLRRTTLESRLTGIKAAYAANNLHFDPQQQLVVTSGFSAEEAQQSLAAYLSRTPPQHLPSAVLAGGDYMAMGAISALTQAGLRVPEEVSVMSMDGAHLAAVHDIQLTAVRIPRSELGEQAVYRLQQRILRPASSRSTILLQGTLTQGESVKRLTAQGVKTAIVAPHDDPYGNERDG